MQSKWFWNSWVKEYKAIGAVPALLFIFGLCFLWFNYWMGPSGVIDWETFQQQEARETISHTFEVGNFEFSIPIESYLTFEYFNGGSLHHNLTASYIFIISLTICTILLLSIITTLDRFWFIAGMALFILFMVSLRMEVLRLFGLGDRMIPIIIMSIYVLAGFYFNTLKPSTSFSLRLTTFMVITIVLGSLIYFFSAVEYPYLHLAVTGYLPALVLSVIFILMIAHEIIAAFVLVTSSGTSSSKSLRHFSIISVVYMVNLVLAYMHEVRIIQWDFLYINLYLLLCISSVLGIWGFRHRETLYSNIIHFNPFGAYFIISLGAITFITTGMLLGNHNDAALKIIRDVIIFSHVGYGAIFLIYIVSNFIIMMAENLNAWKVLYKPTRMPYFTFRFAGLIATMAFVFYSNWREYVYHGMSGFYNHLGDLYELMDRSTLAEAYYQQGRTYGFQNNRSNYALGRIATNKNEFDKAHYHYELANDKRPTEFSMVNNGNLFLVEGKYFDAIAGLTKTYNKFPHSGYVQNNLGFAFSKVHKLDSAFIMFDKARAHSNTKAIADANFMALIGHEYLPIQADSLLQKLNASSPSAASNALAIATLQNQSFKYPVNPITDEQLDMASATLLNNYLVHHLKQLDTAILNTVFKIASHSANEAYYESLKATLAQAYYHQNNVTQALATISELAFLSQIMQGKFNYIAGLWSLEQGSPELAISYFDYAVMFDYKEARLYNAIALAEAGYLTEALVEADSLLRQKDEGVQEIGRQLKKIITHPATATQSLTDLEKYQYCRYRIKTKDTLEFNRVVNTFQNNDYKALALLEMAQRQYDMMNISSALKYFNQLGDVSITDKKLIEKAGYLELNLLAAHQDIQALAEKLNSGFTFAKEHELEKLWYEAMISEAKGDSVTAKRNYSILAHYNPFFEDGVMAAAQYFKVQGDHDLHAYSILAEAIQVNTTSYALWLAYGKEALAVGFDKQAADGFQQAEELKQKK